MVFNTGIEVKESVEVTIKTPEVNEPKEYDGDLTVLELVQRIGGEYSIANLNLFVNGDEVNDDQKDIKIGTFSGSIEAISKTVGNSDSEESEDGTVEEGEKEETKEEDKEETTPETAEPVAP